MAYCTIDTCSVDFTNICSSSNPYGNYGDGGVFTIPADGSGETFRFTTRSAMQCVTGGGDGCYACVWVRIQIHRAGPGTDVDTTIQLLPCPVASCLTGEGVEYTDSQEDYSNSFYDGDTVTFTVYLTQQYAPNPPQQPAPDCGSETTHLADGTSITITCELEGM